MQAMQIGGCMIFVCAMRGNQLVWLWSTIVARRTMQFNIITSLQERNCVVCSDVIYFWLLRLISLNIWIDLVALAALFLPMPDFTLQIFFLLDLPLLDYCESIFRCFCVIIRAIICVIICMQQKRKMKIKIVWKMTLVETKLHYFIKCCSLFSSSLEVGMCRIMQCY